MATCFGRYSTTIISPILHPVYWSDDGRRVTTETYRHSIVAQKNERVHKIFRGIYCCLDFSSISFARPPPLQC
jgi:hypothetical protein